MSTRLVGVDASDDAHACIDQPTGQPTSTAKEIHACDVSNGLLGLRVPRLARTFHRVSRRLAHRRRPPPPSRSSAFPRCTHSSTPERLNFQNRPTLWPGISFDVTHV